MTNEPRWGQDNPHPFSQMKTELIWEGKYDEYGNRRTVEIDGCVMPLQKIETIDEPASRAMVQGNLLRAMKANGSPSPRFETDDDRTYFVSYFSVHPLVVPKETGQTGHRFGPARDQVTAQVTAQVLNYCQEPRKSSEIMALIGLKHWKTFQANYLKPLLQQGLLAITIPEKPRSSKQRYEITAKGRKLIEPQ